MPHISNLPWLSLYTIVFILVLLSFISQSFRNSQAIPSSKINNASSNNANTITWIW